MTSIRLSALTSFINTCTTLHNQGNSRTIHTKGRRNIYKKSTLKRYALLRFLGKFDIVILLFWQAETEFNTETDKQRRKIQQAAKTTKDSLGWFLSQCKVQS
jgi:hypothetical protein